MIGGRPHLVVCKVALILLSTALNPFAAQHFAKAKRYQVPDSGVELSWRKLLRKEVHSLSGLWVTSEQPLFVR